MTGFRVLCFLLLVQVFAFQANAQEGSTFEELIEKAEKYDEVALYGESIKKLTAAVELASKNRNRENEIDATIRLAELLRKSEDFERGLELLNELTDSKKYPELHVKKLGRLAALYNQGTAHNTEGKRDTITAYLQEGLKYAEQLEMPLESASLLNELGFIQMRWNQHKKALKNLEKAASLFNKHGDVHNEIWVLGNLIEFHAVRSPFNITDSVASLAIKKLEGTEWHRAKARVYGIISYSYEIRKDTINWKSWASASHLAALDHIRVNSTKQLSAFQTLYDTKKFKEEAVSNAKEADDKELKLQLQKMQSNNLLAVVITLLVIIICFFYWIARESRLKKRLNETVEELNIANERYHMLIVESNHRIKNNLQMIISMLQYSSKGLDESNARALNVMAGKISTISALHKHLYSDVHNEFVSVDTYFTEIVKLYNSLTTNGFEVNLDIDGVQVRSERIIYFGLIFNEMLANTIEHSNSEDKVINIIVRETDEFCYYRYWDNSAHNVNAKEGTGSLLIQQLVKRVKGTEYKFNPSIGEYSFVFNAVEYLD